jgi:hypothetical protein
MLSEVIGGVPVQLYDRRPCELLGEFEFLEIL